jgi:hypothetical protein
MLRKFYVKLEGRLIIGYQFSTSIDSDDEKQSKSKKNKVKTKKSKNNKQDLTLSALFEKQESNIDGKDIFIV